MLNVRVVAVPWCPNNWMVNTKLDIHICGPIFMVFHFDPHPCFFFLNGILMEYLWSIDRIFNVGYEWNINGLRRFMGYESPAVKHRRICV